MGETEVDNTPDGPTKCIKRGVILKKSKMKMWQKRKARVFPAYLEVAGQKGFDTEGESTVNVIIPFCKVSVFTDQSKRDGNVIIFRDDATKSEYYLQGINGTDHRNWLELFQKQIAFCKENPEIASTYPKPALRITTPTKILRANGPASSVKDGKRFFPKNKKKDGQDSADFRSYFEPGKVFGRLLVELEDDQIDKEHFIPKIMVDTGNFIEQNLHVEGIFRKSASVGLVKSLRERYDKGESDILDDSLDPHAVVGLLKAFLRELKDPLFTFAMYDDWLKFCTVADAEKLAYVRKYFHQLPPLNKNTLRYLLNLLVKVTQQPDNLMNAVNVSICVAPNLLWKVNGTMVESTIESRVLPVLLQFFIENFEEIVQH